MRGKMMLARGRKRAIERMDSWCVISRPGSRVWDEDAGVWVFQPVTVYEGICRLVGGSFQGKKADVAGQLIVVTSPEIHLPANTVGVAPGDDVTIISCESRPDIAGSTYTIREPFEGTQVTALRFRIEADNERIQR